MNNPFTLPINMNGPNKKVCLSTSVCLSNSRTWSLFQGHFIPPESEVEIPTLPSFDENILRNAPPQLLRGRLKDTSGENQPIRNQYLLTIDQSQPGFKTVDQLDFPRIFLLNMNLTQDIINLSSETSTTWAYLTDLIYPHLWEVRQYQKRIRSYTVIIVNGVMRCQKQVILTSDWSE